MSRKEKQAERRRFEEKERAPWTTEQREAYEKRRAALAPIVRDLTTPARAEKKRDPLDVLLGVEEE
jgi:hypothetical protein